MCPSIHVVYAATPYDGLVPGWPWLVDTCNTWFHTDCMGMSSSSYDRINRSDITWICATCDTPNYSTSLSDTYISETSNQFDALSNLDAITAATLDSTNQSSLNSRSSVASSSDFGSPLQRSSPIKRPSRRKNASRPLKILTSNLQSLNAKKEVFWESVDSCQPDLIIANEIWLKPDQLNSEMMPPGFNTPIRQDRGGVMIATKQDLIDSEIKLETECEIVATKVELYQQQPLIIMSAYRPTNNDLTYTQNLLSNHS